MLFGWKDLFIDHNYNFTEESGDWIASCFIIFNIVIWVGQVRKVSDTNE